MSMQRSFEADTGVTHASAYHKVTDLRHSRQAEHMLVGVTIWADATAKTNNKAAVGAFSCRVRGDDYDTYFSNAAIEAADKSAVVKAYEYLKAETEEYDGTQGTVTDV